MPDEPAPRTLADIEAEIGQHRLLYLRATWAGHEGEALFHEAQVDHLIGEWNDLRRSQPAPAE